MLMLTLLYNDTIQQYHGVHRLYIHCTLYNIHSRDVNFTLLVCTLYTLGMYIVPSR